MKTNLLSTRSGSLLVLSARANYKNKVSSPVLESTEGFPKIDWTLLNIREEPQTFAEAKALNRKLIDELAKSKAEIQANESIIEAAQAQMLVQHLCLQNTTQALHTDLHGRIQSAYTSKHHIFEFLENEWPYT